MAAPKLHPEDRYHPSSVRLLPKTERELTRLAKRQRKTRSDMIREALSILLDKHVANPKDKKRGKR